jgi:hypothetical protein
MMGTEATRTRPALAHVRLVVLLAVAALTAGQPAHVTVPVLKP